MGRFRWLLSTFLAAAVGSLAIATVILGSLDSLERPDDKMSFEDMAPRPPSPLPAPKADGLAWSVPKVDRLAMSSEAGSTKFVIQELFHAKRGNRTFIDNRNYVRVSARLSAVAPTKAEAIPPFNPLKLYAPVESSAQDQDTEERDATAVALQVNEILGGVLQAEDGQEVDLAEAAELAQQSIENDVESLAIRPSFVSDSGAEILTPRDAISERFAKKKSDIAASNTTVLTKNSGERDLADDIERNERRVVRAARGDTVMKVLQRLGAEVYLAKAMSEAAKSILPDPVLQPGSEVHVTLVPTLQRGDRFEPAAYSVYGEGHAHRVSVSRNSAGEFVASHSPVNAKLAQARPEDGPQSLTTSLYASLYHGAQLHSVNAETIQLILRIHAPETDYRRAVRPTDAIDLFFDAREEPSAEPEPGDLLFTALTNGSETKKFWRFRTPDGVIDYYDEFGNNSRNFLMRRPFRGEVVNFASGFGMRRHPLLLNVYRPHNGIDWSGPTGTPIVAAGAGVIEFAAYKGEYGNHIRIRHANGYQTTYSHLSRYGPGVREGVNVRQGQVIGFIGNTGLSAGPHLHFEVLVNNRFVDPMKIQVPRERRLTGKLATDFQRERQRIQELMQRPPILTVQKQ